MEIRASDGLQQFASAGVDFAVATLILAVLAASLTQSVYDLGLRRIFHQWWVRAWLSTRGGDWMAWREGTRNGRLYTLHYQRLCGQLSSYLQFELDTPAHWLLLPNMVGKQALEDLSAAKDDPTRAKARQTVNAEMEDALDDLQTLLASRSTTMYYLLGLLFSFGITAMLTLTENQFTSIDGTRSSLVVIGLVAGLMAPIFRNLIERLLAAH